MWNKVNVGFNAEEETVNFGTRACAVNDVAVYETNTLAAILAGEEKPTQLPRVQAQFLQQVGLCVVIDTSLTVFTETCNAVRCTISLQSNVDVFAVTPCGHFLLVGASGQIICFHIATQGSKVFTRSVHSTGSLQSFVTLDFLEENNQIHIVLLLTSGKLFRSTPIDFQNLEENVTQRRVSAVEDISQHIDFKEIHHIKNLKSQVLIGQNFLKTKKSIFLGTTESIGLVHAEDFDLSLCDLMEGYKISKIGGVVNNSVLFALTDDGYILQICMYTMNPYYLYTKMRIRDFVVLEGSGANEGSILALVDDGNVSLVSLSWPDFKVNYRLPVAETSFLISQKGSEEVLFLEGFGIAEIDTIRVKAIIESQPDLRLERILRRGKFEEAEKFARAFSLNLEIVYKAHVQRLCQDLNPWSTTLDCQKKIFSKILELIEKIKDHYFVAEVCGTAIPPDFDMLHTMLMYGMERFSKVADKSGANLSELLDKVSTISRRLDTCMLIHGSATTVEHWIEFPKHDLVMSCLNHIKRGEIKESILIWSRHLSDMRPLFTMEEAKSLMNGIPKATKLQELLLWLHHFVPPILSFFPNILIDVVQWVVQRSRDLEIFDPKVWPDSGLALAKCLLQLIHTPFTEKSILLQSQRVALRNENLSHHSPQNLLLHLMDTLEDINTLKKSYGVNIQYHEFVQEDHSSFVAVLFERLPLENISAFMVDFYHRLMMDRGLDPDSQILQFIQDIVMNCEDWWFWDEAPWEARVAALVPHINNIQIKLDAILHVLKSAPVPWTAIVTQLADQGVRLSHYKASDVRNECNNVPKRLIMKKYSVLFDKKHERQLVHLILKAKPKSMLQDIHELAKCVKGNISDIYLIVMINLIENGEDNMVWEMLQSVDKDCKEECMSQLIFRVIQLLEYGAWDKVPAYFRFMPALDNPKEKQRFAELKNIYALKVEFDIKITSGTVYIPGERETILENYAKKIVQELISGSLTEYLAQKKISRLAFLLHMTVEEGVIVLSRQCVKHNLQLALSFTSHIEDLKMKPNRVYSKVSVLIEELSAKYKPIESPSTVIESFASITSNVARLYRTYSDTCHFDNICCRLSMLSHTIGCSKSILKSIYGDPSSTATSATLVHTCIKNIINCYIKSFDKADFSDNKSVSTSLINSNEVPKENKDLTQIWRRLREEQQDLTCIRLIIDYCCSQKIINPTHMENASVDSFLTQCIKDLLKKLFRLRNFDLELALSLLHFFSKEEALSFLVEETQSVGYNYQRLSAISQLALTYCDVNKIDKLSKKFKKHHVSCKWAKKLNELGLPYKDAFKDTDTEHKQLISKLISLPSITILLLKEFCLDMNFDQQECLMIYLEYLLLSWQPDMLITEVPSSGEKVMVVKNSSHELLQQCRAVLHQLGTKVIKSELGSMSWSESVQSILCNLWNKVNYYYYEVYYVLVDLYQKVLAQQVAMEQINSYQTMLGFLLSYNRISSPSETEQEQWFQLFPNTNHLPPISNYRLPFTPFFVKEPPWATIKPELSLKTYKIWYDIIPNLGLDRDMLCTLTIQRLTSDQLAGGSKGKSGWLLQACNNSVLQDIQECVRHIRNQEMASAALYYVVNHMPPGADQMSAANLCYRQAETWISQDPSDKAKAGFAKVQKKYLTVCTSHILHSSGLGKQEYLELVLHPQELICALYDDPSILHRKTGTLSHCPDINSVVMAVGQLHRVNVVGIQQELLSEWLYPPDCPQLDNSCDDITQNIAAILNGPTIPSDNDSIIRACYVLESMELETAAKYLVSYTGELDNRPTAVRLRALQCLCAIATADIIVNTTGRTLDSIKGNMQNLMFISELEKLGLVWSVKGFESCDKEDVVRILLMKGSPHAVQLAAAMGCVFKLVNVFYWNQTLQLMTSYGMVEELVIVLPELTHLCHLLNSNIFTGAWNYALIIPLQKAEYPLSEDSSRHVQRSLEMLYCCPVPRHVNLSLMVEHYQRLHRQDLISRLQPFLFLTESSNQGVKVKEEKL